MTALQQTQAEIYRVFEDWEALYAPANLIKTTESASLILNWILNSGRVVSFTSLNAAVDALASQVLTPEPKAKTTEELAAEENAKMHRDFMKSIAPQESFDEKVARDKQKRLAADAAKAQADAKGQLALTIDGYQAYKENGSGIDYPTTEMVKRELTPLRVGNDFVRTLAVVKQIIQELPDHPKMGDVARVVERLNRETSSNSNSKPRKDSFGSGASFRG